MTKSQESFHQSLRVLSGSTRFPIVLELLKRDMTLTELAKALGMTLCRTSHQISLLHLAGLVSRTKSGKNATYSLMKGEVGKVINLK